MPAPVLMATLGIEPQVVTITFQLLRDHYHVPMEQVVVIHTGDPLILAALEQIRTALAEYGVSVHPVPVATPAGISVDDITTQADAHLLWDTIYTTVARLKDTGTQIHFGIGGGRKPMSIYGMVVAQTLFDESDHVWYLVTPNWQPGNSRRLFTSGDSSFLVPIPLAPWGASPAYMAQMLHSMHRDRIRPRPHSEVQYRREHFFEHVLSPAERELLPLLREGYTNEQIAERLSKSIKTINNQIHYITNKFAGYFLTGDDYETRRILMIELTRYYDTHDE